MTRKEAIEALRGMVRDSKNGKECTVCLHYTARTVYSWDLIRHDVELTDTETEYIKAFTGPNTWPDAAAYVREYLNNNPEDGFYMM